MPYHFRMKAWSSVKVIAGNGENLYNFQVLTSQAICFSKASCTS